MTTTILTASTKTSPVTIQPNDPKKLVEYLMNDLRSLSTEARKKHNHIKEAAESGLVKVRNMSMGSSDNLLQTMRAACTEILHPFLLGCSSKNNRIVQISLQSIQRLLQFQAINVNAVPGIVNELWNLTEAECEELKVLQTITQFVSTELLLVTDWALAKCIVLAFRLNFSKDSSVINAASAAVRQLFNFVFERVIQEDGIRGGVELQILPQQQQRSNQQTMAPPTLRPAAADAFLLLRDLCTLIRKEPPNWLIGVQKITPILALELLEAVVKNYPSIFFKHSEFAELLKTQICVQIIKILLGERELAVLTNANGTVQQQQSSTHNQYHPLPVSAALLGQQFHQQSQSPMATIRARDFPIMIRALRICLSLITHYHTLLGHPQNEVIIHFLLDLLHYSTTSWEAAVAIEVLHKLLAQPTLLSFGWFCENQDGPKFVELIFFRLTAFVKKSLEEAAIDGQSLREENYPRPGFVYKGVFLPLDETQLTAKRSILLDWLDKHHAEKILDAYCLSVGFATLIDSTHSIYSAIEGEHSPSQKRKILGEEKQQKQKHLEYSDRAKELYLSSYGYLILGLSTLLEFSMDDSLSEQLLNCLSSLNTLACRIGLSEAKHVTLKAICRAALPSNYYSKFIEPKNPTTAIHQHSNGSFGGGRTVPSSSFGFGNTIIGGDLSTNEPSVEPTQVVAMGTVCPSSHLPSNLFNTPVMLTAKNLQVARLLINCVHSNGHFLDDCWEMALTTIQHFVWIIGLRPTFSGSFRAGGETIPSSEGGGTSSGGISTTSSASNSGASNVILTTAASSELPDLNQHLNVLFESSTQLDEVSLHHVIAALCKLSNESMIVAQMSNHETFFSIAKLLQTSLVNLDRLQIFWRPVTAHLLELCAHSNANIREWGAFSLTQLVKNALQQAVKGEQKINKQNEMAKREQLILNPLSAMNEIDFLDIRSKQLDCLMRILQTGNRPFEPQLWPMIIQIVTAIVTPEGRITDSSLIDQGFRALSIIVKEFLGTLPFDCVELLIDTDALFGQQQSHLNVSLASIGQLWDISDFVRRETNQYVTKQQREEAEKVWLVIYQALGRLCVDARPPVRKSACDTLLQTVAAHGQALGTQCWAKMVTEILFPMLDRVRLLTQSASTQKSSTNSLGAPNLMIHHSRDTEYKQWTETSVKTLGGVVKIFNAQRHVLLLLENFPDCWSQLLKHIELAAQANNSEMSLAALKNFQELLFGRPQQTESNNGMPKSGKQSTETRTEPDLSLAPALPEPLWILSWSAWFSVTQAIISAECPSVFDPSLIIMDEQKASSLIPTIRKHYVPGLYHLSTLLEILLWLFYRIRHHVPVEDICQNRIGKIFQEIAAVPISIDQLSLSMAISSQQSTDQQLNMAQEYLFTCTRTIIQEQIDPGGRLREALPDMLRMLLSFIQFAWKAPKNKFAYLQLENVQNLSSGSPSPNLINFGEISMKMLLEFYTKTANFDEVIQQTILVDIIKNLGEPMTLKYGCPNQSTWKLAATTFNKICQVGLPIARENVNLFKQLWPTFVQAIEGFLFTSSKVHCLLNADERKRHEFMDCLMIELIRTELLPFANKLPRDFMQQQIIQILNRGSINTMDANDVLASDVYQQRTDLSRVCFDALLSLTQMENPSSSAHQQSTKSAVYSGESGMLRNTSQSSATCSSLGATAIASLLNRCKQVLNEFARDEQNSGRLRLPQERIFETISALRAVTALIEGFSKNPSATLYSHLVTMHPTLVQLIPSSRGDPQVELALMACLNSYQTLLLLNLHNHNS